MSGTARILELEQQMLRLVKATDEIQRKQLSSIRGLEAKVFELQHVVMALVRIVRPEVAFDPSPSENTPCH